MIKEIDRLRENLKFLEWCISEAHKTIARLNSDIIALTEKAKDIRIRIARLENGK